MYLLPLYKLPGLNIVIYCWFVVLLSWLVVDPQPCSQRSLPQTWNNSALVQVDRGTAGALTLKGHYVVLGNFKILNTGFCIFKSIDEVTFCYWINKLFSKVSVGRLKLENWQGPPHRDKVDLYEIVLSFMSSLFIQFIQTWKQRGVFV